MSTRIQRRVVIVAVLTVIGLNTPVEAAKGVKKVTSTNTPRTYSGIVVSLSPNGNGSGKFVIRTTHRFRKTGTATQSKIRTHEFAVNGSTQFMHHNGTAANGSQLHVGERVRVRAVNNTAATNGTGHHQALIVQYISHMRSPMIGRFVRHRSHYYMPTYHHRYHHHHRRF